MTANTDSGTIHVTRVTSSPRSGADPNNTSLERANMRHDETRDNTTDIENQIREADAHADTREIARKHDEIVANARQESAEFLRNSRHIRLIDDPTDPEHDPIGDADTEYDIEYDDGQPSEYEEWQDYMGGDEYYDHSENECW